MENQNQEQLKLKNSPRDVFLHLLMIVSLYLSVIAFIVLNFQYIDVLFPDKLQAYYDGNFEAIRLFSSILIISLPVFLALSWVLEKDFRKNADKHKFWVRKWLVYFTLFIASLVIIVDLIGLVNSFYKGELTVKFLIKVLIVLIVAAVVFGYYFWDLKRKSFPSKESRITAWAISCITVSIIIGGFFIVGTPAQQRLVRFDEKRISDLQNIQSQIINYWTHKEKLPEKLSDLKDSISGFTPPVDPDTDNPYEYRVIDDLSFELCAEFKTENLESETNSSAIRPTIYNGFYSENWPHTIGRVCFERVIDPDLYKKPELIY